MSSIHLISLGCAKNLVDSERLAAGLIEALNLEVTADPREADLILINTCAFIAPAAEEAVNTVLETAALKKAGAKLIVAGCLPSRFGEELAGELPEIDLIAPPAVYGRLEELTAGILGVRLPADIKPSWPFGPRLLSTPFFRAYLKIAEGCRNACAFCLIPKLRGGLKSQPRPALVQEARRLTESGAAEITLVAQDITAYGRDLDGANGGLPELVAELTALPGLKWLRLMYAYPEGLLQPGLLEFLARQPKVVPYLDLPLQHVSPKILKLMGRGGQPEAAAFIRNLRKAWPDLALRTTFMVGFPGETEDDFNELLEFVSEVHLDQVGVFKFSPEEGTPAAGFADQTAKAIKEKRRRRLMAAQRKVARRLARARIGRIYPVLAEGPSRDSHLIMTGRAPFQAPEVDGLIYFSGQQPETGQLVEAKIVKAAGPYDLVAEMA